MEPLNELEIAAIEAGKRYDEARTAVHTARAEDLEAARAAERLARDAYNAAMRAAKAEEARWEEEDEAR